MLHANLFILGSGGGAPGVEFGTIIFQLAVFLLLMALLKKYAFGPLMKVMKEREEQIAKDIDEAQESNVQARKLVEEHKALVKNAHMEAQQLLEDSRKRADAQTVEIIATAKREATHLKEAAVLEIQQEKAKAIEELQGQISAISVQIASKIIHKELNEQDQSKLIQDFLNDIQKDGER